MITLKEYFDTNVAEKDGEWAARVVTYMRQMWKPLVDPRKYKDNIDVILSKDNLDEVRAMFKEPDKLGFELTGIIIMEKIRNILIAERVKVGISVNVKASDPSSQVERESDKELLQNRKEIEGLLSELNQSIGLPEYKLSQEIQKNGDRPFAGNVELFDQLGLDETSEYETAYFFEVWHKLMHEIDSQQVVNTVFAANEVDKNIEYWCNDIMACKRISSRQYVNQNSGAIEIKYLCPAKHMHIPGKRDDGRDAICQGYEEDITIIDLVRLMGAEIDIEQEMTYLINAVNTLHKTDIIGIVWGEGNSVKYFPGAGSLCNINEFLQFKISIGYIEWKTINASTEKAGTDWHGNHRIYPLYNEDADVNDSSSYVKENYYNQETYKCFYLPTSTYDQRIYKFGRIYHQVVEGAEDEYSSYTLAYKALPGPSVADISRTYIKIAQETFNKFRWFIRKAKPKGQAFNYQSLVDIAKKLFEKTNGVPDIQAVIRLYEEGINQIYMPPKSPTGGTMGGGSNPTFEVPNGLDSTAITFKDIIEWAVARISDSIGIMPREASAPKQNVPYKSHEEANDQSRNATEYMNTMIDDLSQGQAKYILLVSQDILYFKSSLPYRWLLNQLGNPVLNRLTRLGKVALHRYAIFVNSYGNYVEKQMAKQNTMLAYQRGEIAFEVMMLLNDIPDPTKVNYILAFEKKRSEQMEVKKEQQLSNIRLSEDKQKTENLIQVENTRGSWWAQRENIRGKWWWMTAMAQNKSKEEIKKMTLDAEPDKISSKASADIQKETAKHILDTQSPLPGPTSSDKIGF